MGKPYPKFRRAERHRERYRPANQRRRKRQATARPFFVDVIAGALTVGAITFIATPSILSTWRTITMSRTQLAATESSVYYAGCDEARVAGVATIYRGSPGYRPELD